MATVSHMSLHNWGQAHPQKLIQCKEGEMLREGADGFRAPTSMHTNVCESWAWQYTLVIPAVRGGTGAQRYRAPPAYIAS